MNKRLISQYRPSYPSSLVYMLQNTEYETKPYLAWYKIVDDFSKVAKRRILQKTRATQLLTKGLYGGMLLQILLGLGMVVVGWQSDLVLVSLLGLIVILFYPQTWAYLVVVPLWGGRTFLVTPKHKKLIAASERIFREHRGVKIAVIGSYGKTTMKELLSTVLSEGKKVAATPANKNVAISHAYFGTKLDGDEDVLILEYGEGKPGDIRRFAQNTHPDKAIITGLAPAHLDQYPTLKAAGNDLFSITNFVRPENIYVNDEAEAIKKYLVPEFKVFNFKKAWDWKIEHVTVDFEGVSFTMTNPKQNLHLKSGLLGIHQVGPLAAVAAIAVELGLTSEQIEAGVRKTTAFEHRMQARALGGGWIIDDTYNGNIEGMKAGLRLLKQLPGKRKIYVTPGLVDQGIETANVHVTLGELIASANPEKVILMKNSVTEYIEAGLRKRDFKGAVTVEDDPLQFYSNLDHFVAAGDVIMLQNDWTDNYN